MTVPERDWLSSFPARVWEQTERGLWCSRQTTKEDWERRKAFIQVMVERKAEEGE